MGQASFDALPDYSSTPRGSDIVPIKNFDKERVEQWRYTATTIDRNLTRSPDTPRRFNEEETKGLMGKSTNDGNESKSVVQANASVPRAQESSSSGSSLLHPGFSRTRQNMDAQRFTSDLQFSPSKVSPNKGKKAGDPKKVSANPPTLIRAVLTCFVQLSSTDTPERTQETASQALRKIMIARALNESIVDTLTVEISLTVICLQKPPPLNLNKVTRRPRSRSEVHSRDHSIVVNHPIRLAAAKDDPQTYTTHGLVLVLGKLYEPSAIPSPVAAALPSPMDVATLYDATTPLGSAFHARQTLQGSSSRTNATKDFQPKDVNYITFYIDTLLAKVKEQDRMIYLLEEDNEDKEVDKAQLQTHISHFYHEAKMGEKKYDSLQMLACFLLESIPTNKSLEAVAVAGHLGINLVTLMADAQDVSNPAANRVAATKTAAQKALKKVKRLEHDVEYWRARAEASEKFNAIVQEIEAARENA
jgi:hypothetical protein